MHDKSLLRIGIIGDYSPASRFHAATNAALQHAADALSLGVDITWLPTPVLEKSEPKNILGQFNALLCAPGSPYQSMDGALAGIQYARERGRPFVGT
jgi:CTP synthase (UTP-ammonia lyase)